MRRRNVRLGAALAWSLAVSLEPGRARAQATTPCFATATPAALSEARAARWLVGEDLLAQSHLDVHRAYKRGLLAEHGVAPPAWEVFATAGVGGQWIAGASACSSRGTEEATLERYRLFGATGVTHRESGLHLRVSFVGAADQLAFDVPRPEATADSDDDDVARAGYRQGLVALRFGHHRWGRLVIGRLTAEGAYGNGANGVTLTPRLPTSRTSPWFYGVDVPALHMSLLTVGDTGGPELIQVMARDLTVPGSSTALSLGPTYIREERQTVGFFRVRGNALGALGRRKRRPGASTVGDETVFGETSEAAFLGPVAEISVETGDARLRHARFRWEASEDSIFMSERQISFVRGSIHAEATVFRSRFFEASRPGGRPAAFGLGAGLSFDVEWRPFALAVDLSGGFNRPELLSLLPSTAGQAEGRATLGLRVEN